MAQNPDPQKLAAPQQQHQPTATTQEADLPAAVAPEVPAANNEVLFPGLPRFHWSDSPFPFPTISFAAAVFSSLFRHRFAISLS